MYFRIFYSDLVIRGSVCVCWWWILVGNWLPLGKVKKELDHDDNHLHLDETTKLLQDLHEAQADRVGSRPSSNLSSLSNTSERDQHHLGKVTRVTEVAVLLTGTG